jgi:hypothetical protein
MRIEVGFIIFNSGRAMMFLVTGTRGTWRTERLELVTSRPVSLLERAGLSPKVQTHRSEGKGHAYRSELRHIATEERHTSES